MDVSTFEATFQNFPDPVAFHAEKGWHFNPAADAISLSGNELDLLAGVAPPEGSVWLRNTFYRVTVCTVDGGAYYILRADKFLPTAGATLSMQLRQPLSDALLAMHRADAASKSKKEDLAKLNHSLHRIHRIIDQLDKFTQPIETMCHLESMDLAGFLKEFYQRVLHLTEGMPVAITLDLGSPTALIQGDSTLLVTLFEHLLSNAIKAVPKEDGKIAITLRRLEQKAVVTVSDNGPGLPPGSLSSPLWSQPNALVMGRGAGLGLPIVQRIVSAHRGTLVTNASPEGARITVSFPVYGSGIVLCSPDPSLDLYGGYSQDLITLADVLPNDRYYPFD